MNDWRNEQAILQDLAIAQGMVPVESVETVKCNEKPPSLHIEEETEEQFIQQYVADESSSVAPDFGQIQDMLDLVRDVSVNDIENCDENTEKTEKVTDVIKNKSPRKPETVDYVKKNKNVAMESILNQQKECVTMKNQPVLIQPQSMFRPKSKTSVNTSKESVVKDLSNVSASKVSKQEGVSKPGVFVPSSEAQEYYKKLMEAKRLQELREETIWTRAERQMREIEERSGVTTWWQAGKMPRAPSRKGPRCLGGKPL